MKPIRKQILGDYPTALSYWGWALKKLSDLRNRFLKKKEMVAERNYRVTPKVKVKVKISPTSELIRIEASVPEVVLFLVFLDRNVHAFEIKQDLKNNLLELKKSKVGVKKAITFIDNVDTHLIVESQSNMNKHVVTLPDVVGSVAPSGFNTTLYSMNCAGWGRLQDFNVIVPYSPWPIVVTGYLVKNPSAYIRTVNGGAPAFRALTLQEIEDGNKLTTNLLTIARWGARTDFVCSGRKPFTKTLDGFMNTVNRAVYKKTPLLSVLKFQNANDFLNGTQTESSVPVQYPIALVDDGFIYATAGTATSTSSPSGETKQILFKYEQTKPWKLAYRIPPSNTILWITWEEHISSEQSYTFGGGSSSSSGLSSELMFKNLSIDNFFSGTTSSQTPYTIISSIPFHRTGYYITGTYTIPPGAVAVGSPVPNGTTTTITTVEGGTQCPLNGEWGLISNWSSSQIEKSLMGVMDYDYIPNTDKFIMGYRWYDNTNISSGSIWNPLQEGIFCEDDNGIGILDTYTNSRSYTVSAKIAYSIGGVLKTIDIPYSTTSVNDGNLTGQNITGFSCHANSLYLIYTYIVSNIDGVTGRESGRGERIIGIINHGDTKMLIGRTYEFIINAANYEAYFPTAYLFNELAAIGLHKG
jgi:hypothetical protein